MSAHVPFVAEAAAGGHARETNSVGTAWLPRVKRAGRVLGTCLHGHGHGPGPPQRSGVGGDPGLHSPSVEATRLPRGSPPIRLCLNEKHKGRLAASPSPVGTAESDSVFRVQAPLAHFNICCSETRVNDSV